MGGWLTNRRTGKRFPVPKDQNVITFANRNADAGWIFRHAQPQADGSVKETWTREAEILYMRYDPNTDRILSVEVE